VNSDRREIAAVGHSLLKGTARHPQAPGAGGTKATIALELNLTPEFIDLIADAVAERLAIGVRRPERWLCGAEAAASYLGWPKARVYNKLRRLPHSRDGRLLMFSTDQLDRFIAEQYEGPPRLATPGPLPFQSPIRVGAPKR
jgi:hypothetical protein